MSPSAMLAKQSIDPAPVWWVTPNAPDWLAWGALLSIALAIYLAMHLYAKFDTWAEYKSEGTPLAKTIPTLLTIALLYEIFPLDHFSILLPFIAILIAMMADWMHQLEKNRPAAPEHETATPDSEPAIQEPKPATSNLETATPDQEAITTDQNGALETGPDSKESVGA